MSKFLLSCVLLVLFTYHGLSQLAGQECFPQQKTDQLVYDVAGILSSEETRSLESRLQQFAVSSSNEIFIVIVPDLCGMDKAQFATELGEKWGAGQEKEDNGVVILVKPKSPESQGQVFIAIGRGLEGAIPDATAHLIVENEMIPSFKSGNMYGGISDAANTVMELASGEYNSEAYASRYKKRIGKNSGIVMIIILIVMALVFLNKRNNVKRYARLNNIGFWQAWILLNSINRRHSGSWSDFSGGRGHFGGWSGGGGGGGGGFGGFGGGGSFGGGGAGGSW